MMGKKRHHRSSTGIGPRCGAVGYSAVTVAALLAAVTVGCGTDFGRPLVYVDCGAGRALADEIVVLDWDGGVSGIYPDDPFDGLDLSSFETTDGGTLADRADEFKSLVRDRVASIYCDRPGQVVSVMQKDDANFAGAKTTVFFGQFRAPGGGGQVGEADYDPCNRYASDEAIIFGEQYLRLGGPFSFDEWVTMYANTAAHEIGHTLGYGHIDRSDRPDPAQSLYVELMLERHTLSELQRQQRIIVEQSTCSEGVNSKAQAPDDDLVFECGKLTGQ